MYKSKKILAIIPARGGSKGLPGKNIKELAGKPLISWSIEAGLQSSWIDELIVNTDSEKIAAVARNSGGKVPFLRPTEQATDSANTMDVLLHTINWYEKQDVFFDLIIVLQPTSPLRTGEDIDQAVQNFFKKNADCVVSVCMVEHHPYWTNQLPADGCMDGFLRPEAINTPRQQLPDYYGLNGAVYIAAIPWLKKHKSFFGKKTYAYVMEPERSVDIDTIIDFRLAEILLRERTSE